MRRLGAWLVTVALLGAVVLLLPFASIGQEAVRLVGTLSTGGVKNVAVDSNGSLQISVLAGGSTQTMRPAGVVFWDDTDAPNLADTNFVIGPVYAIPAGMLATNGDQLLFEAILTFSAAVSTKTYDCRIGYTSFAADATGFTGGITLRTNTTSATSTSLWFRSVVTRQSATTASTVMTGIFGSAAVHASTFQTGQAITWANANNIACAVKEGSSNAAAVTVSDTRVTFFPK